MDKIIIVGAGLSGAITARLFAENGYDITIVDRREVIGGNAYDFVDKNGITIQPYGPHVFRTDDDGVFELLSKFTEWIPYKHKVLAKVRKDKLVHLPFNLNALKSLFPKDKAERIREVLISEIGMEQKVPILKLKNHPNKEIREFADFVYKNIFYIYTMKQWGFKPEQLGAEVMNRVPVHVSENDGYYLQKHQYMPKDGYTQMIANILRHPRIKLKLKTDAKKAITLQGGVIYLNGKPFDGILIYTGCVDELFDYKFGVLPYRSLKFKFKTLKVSSYQRSAVVNYTTSHKFTRITEFSKFTCEPKDNTVIMREYPVSFKKGKNIPYYPIPIEKNRNHHQKYQEEAKQYKNLFLLGRLANYKYINMDVAVRNSIKLYEYITGDEFDITTITETTKSKGNE